MRRLLLCLVGDVDSGVGALVLASNAFDAGGAGAVGVMAVIRTLPGAPAGPLLAREGDRRSRRAILVVVNAVGAAVLAATAVAVATNAPLALVYALVAVVAVAGPATSSRRRLFPPPGPHTVGALWRQGRGVDARQPRVPQRDARWRPPTGGDVTDHGLVVLAGLFAVSLRPLTRIPHDRPG